MGTTTTTEWTTTAVDEAIGAIEGLLRRPKEQSLFTSEEVVAVLDRVDFALLLAPGFDGVDLGSLAEISAAARDKAEGQPAVDAAATKGGVLLDLWDGLSALRAASAA